MGWDGSNWVHSLRVGTNWLTYGPAFLRDGLLAINFDGRNAASFVYGWSVFYFLAHSFSFLIALCMVLVFWSLTAVTLPLSLFLTYLGILSHSGLNGFFVCGGDLHFPGVGLGAVVTYLLFLH